MVYLSLIREYDDKHVCIYENRCIFGSKENAEQYQKEDLLDRISSPDTSWNAKEPNIIRYPSNYYVRYDLEEHDIKN